MKKEDLKTGMIVETKCGSRHIVIKDAIIEDKKEDIIVGVKKTYNLSESYNDDLSNTEYSYLDITKVFIPKSNNLIHDMYDCCLESIWERKEPPQLTERERAYLKAYSYDYVWVTRGDDDCLTFFEGKPVKTTNGWYIDNIFNTDNLCKKDLFSFIKWEDEEPYKIKDLLEEE